MAITIKKIKKYLKQVYYDIDGHGPVPQNVICGENNRFPPRYSIDNQNTRESIVIGQNNWFHNELHIRNYNKGKIKIGNYNWASLRLQIVCAQSVEIGNYCMIARDVFICDTDEHPIDPDLRLTYAQKFFKDHKPPERYEGVASAPIKIGNNVWLCERVMILKGVTIGDNSIIAAGSLVVRDIPPNCVAAGYPAMVTRKLK